MPAYDPATRHLLTHQLRAAMDAGRSLRAAAGDLSLPVATAKNWLDRLSCRGSLADARRDRSGRPAAVSLTAAEAGALRALVLQRRMSEESAIRAFVRSDACLPETRGFILGRLAAADSAPRQDARRPRWPESLRRAMHVTEQEILRYYGPTAARSRYIPSQRRLTYVTEDGREIPLRPHTVWIFDDYSTNKPYWLEYAAGKFRCCRQILAGMDLYTNGWLGFLHVGKERDAYTGGDALRVIRSCMEAHGTRPEIIILEKGRWHGKGVRGLRMPNGARWGSIEECGLKLIYGIDSRDKAEIEAGFLPLQTELEGGADIGHLRGLHERESDSYLAVNQGRRDPRACGFMSLSQSDEQHILAARALNNRRKSRQALGYASADELFAESPVALRPLSEQDAWLFFPHKTEATVGTLGSDLVGCTVDGTRHLFVVNGIADGVFLGNGHRVYLAFDPERPDLGCAVANADAGTANREGWRAGQLLMRAAPAWSTIPRIDLRPMDARDADAQAHWKLRKGAVKAAAEAFSSILPGGKRGMRSASRRDREGNLKSVTWDPDGTAPATPAPDMAPRIPRTDIPAIRTRRWDGDSPTAHPRLKSPHSEPPADAADCDDLDVLEAAAQRAAGLIL